MVDILVNGRYKLGPLLLGEADGISINKGTLEHSE